MISVLVQESELAEATGYIKQDGQVDRGQLKRYLKRLGIPFQTGRGGRIWTTARALDQVLGVSEREADGLEIYHDLQVFP